MVQQTLHLRAIPAARILGITLTIAFGAAVGATVIPLLLGIRSATVSSVVWAALVLMCVGIIGLGLRPVLSTACVGCLLTVLPVMLTPLSLIQTLPVMSVAVAEEILYRWYCMTRLEQHLGNSWAIFFSSLLFAVMHFEPAQLLRQVVLGCVLALLMKLTGRVEVSAGAHMLHNLIILLGRRGAR